MRAGVHAGPSVFVSLHTAGAAPAAPAPSAGPHAPRRAAGVRARLANAAAPLHGALSPGASRIHTCWTPVRPVRLEPKHVVSEAGGPPFCLRQLSALCPDFGASDLGPLQQRFLLRVPLLRSPVFQSRSFSLSGITTTSSSGAL